ncbi:MAG: hypothetical protein CK546_09420 [Pedosphaera sp.]|nr:hypothetical protein [Pedosphaera sp.]PHX93050.1 MAG: hypothetical protein CK546_09420 [Pedosphaera sp.]
MARRRHGERDEAGNLSLSLRDLTGFDGRCDAILLTTDPVFQPSNDSAPLAPWRMALAGLPPKPEEAGQVDLVVVGGGYGGMGAARCEFKVEKADGNVHADAVQLLPK